MFAPLFLVSIGGYITVAVIVILLIVLVVSNVIIVPRPTPMWWSVWALIRPHGALVSI